MEWRFVNPQSKKNKLWLHIGESMSKEGFNVSATDCHMKYRNLLQTYRTNKEKRLKSTGESSIKWEFFDLFDSVLGSKASTIPPAELLLDNVTTSNEENADNSSGKNVNSSAII